MSLVATARPIPGTLRQEVVIDGRHRLITDEPQHLGGDGSGPAPHELFPAALAACISRSRGRNHLQREDHASRRPPTDAVRCGLVSRKQIVILGGGTGGTMAANRLRRRFEADEAEIHVVDRDDLHVYQPGVELNVELEHGLHDLATNVTDDDPHITAKIALAHLNEFPDYYTRLERLERMEEEAKQD